MNTYFTYLLSYFQSLSIHTVNIHSFWIKLNYHKFTDILHLTDLHMASDKMSKLFSHKRLTSAFLFLYKMCWSDYSLLENFIRNASNRNCSKTQCGPFIKKLVQTCCRLFEAWENVKLCYFFFFFWTNSKSKLFSALSSIWFRRYNPSMKANTTFRAVIKCETEDV